LTSINAAGGASAMLVVHWRSGSMRRLSLGMAAALLATTSALADSRWLESGRLEVSEIKLLCEHVSNVYLLARMQMISSGDERWRRLSRQELVVETTMMGAPPLDPRRCYVIARAGAAAEMERRAFEIRDFSVNSERTSVFVIGRGYDAP
jgi:hypothetical protein